MTPARFAHKVARQWTRDPEAGALPRCWRAACDVLSTRAPKLAAAPLMVRAMTSALRMVGAGKCLRHLRRDPEGVVRLALDLLEIAHRFNHQRALAK